MVGKTSEKEEEYFARMEFEKRRKIMEEGHKKLQKRGKESLRNCIICDARNVEWS